MLIANTHALQPVNSNLEPTSTHGLEPKRIITDFVPEFQMGRFHDPKKTHSLFVFKSLLTTKCVPSYILHVCL